MVPAHETRIPLDEPRILTAASQLADATGQVPPMRAIAAELGCSPMALYRHVPDKASLVHLLLEQVYAELRDNPTLAAAPDAAAALSSIATHAHAVLLHHRWFPVEAAATPPTGPNGLDYTETCLTALTRHGWALPRSSSALGAVMTYVTGAVLLAPNPSTSVGAPDRETASPDPSRWPLIHAHAISDSVDGDSFAAGLDALIAGLAA